MSLLSFKLLFCNCHLNITAPFSILTVRLFAPLDWTISDDIRTRIRIRFRVHVEHHCSDSSHPIPIQRFLRPECILEVAIKSNKICPPTSSDLRLMSPCGLPGNAIMWRQIRGRRFYDAPLDLLADLCRIHDRELADGPRLEPLLWIPFPGRPEKERTVLEAAEKTSRILRFIR
jgi:hypothetical protein